MASVRLSSSRLWRCRLSPLSSSATADLHLRSGRRLTACSQASSSKANSSTLFSAYLTNTPCHRFRIPAREFVRGTKRPCSSLLSPPRLSPTLAADARLPPARESWSLAACSGGRDLKRWDLARLRLGRSDRPFSLHAVSASRGGGADVARGGTEAGNPGSDVASSWSTREAAVAAGPGEGLLAYYADHYVVPLPDGHRFPMDKYRSMRLLLQSDASLDRIMAVHPAPLVSREELQQVHEEGYLSRLFSHTLSPQEQRLLGFPWSPHLLLRSQASCGGTVAATHAVLMGLRRAAGVMAGGTHHAFRGHGEGFCVFNDIAVAAMTALQHYPFICNAHRPILALDLDVHQGNGTASIFESDPRVVTFSMHGANNYPWRSKMRSDYDVELPDDTEDAAYLSVLADWLPRLIDEHRPSLVLFQAGVDALKEDSFGRLAMTRAGMLRRNNMVYSVCINNNIPLVITMGGGYSRPPDASIAAHADVYRSAAYRFSVLQQAARK